MKVSYKWLQQYVDLDIHAEELAKRLTMAGLAVEHVEFLGEGIENVVVGEILDIKKHPEADKLVICNVNVGEEILQIVTGASNVKAGHRVPIAKIGARLPGQSKKFKKAKLRGVESFGMMCSAGELNIDEAFVSDESKNGILILSQDAPVGEDILKILNLDDTVLEFELTPNRSDCLSVINIAREVAAITGKSISLPEITLPENQENIDDIASVKVDDTDLCKRYVAKVIKNVQIAPSPQWMQHYLMCAGVRPINNIVDITNYVMLEMGQPLHAFDYDLLAEHTIVVRRAKEKEKMFTLDEQEREFNTDTLLICDGEKPVAVAGVMGGLETEVSDNTKNILLEAAYFHPTSVRRTSRILGLRSESSLRFEKGLDIQNVKNAANRAIQLMAELAGGEIVAGTIDSLKEAYVKNIVELRTPRVNQMLGTNFTTEEIANIFTELAFPTEIEDSKLTVEIPSYRQDITREIDLVEEVARLKGYDKIPTTLPSGTTTQGNKTKQQAFEDYVKDLLISVGLMEVITFSFISPKALDKINLPGESLLRNVVEVKNPLSEEQSVMRTSLVPGLLEVAARNTSRRNTNITAFECGHIFLPGAEKLPHEPLVLGALVSGELSQGWNWKPQNLDFYFLKGIMAELFDRLGIKDWQLVKEEMEPYLHPGRAGNVYVGDEKVGFIGEIHPQVQENYDLADRAYVFQINLNPVLELAQDVVKYSPLAKYPAVERDMALLSKDNVPAQEIEEVIRKNGGKILTKVKLFDVYKGTQIPEGYKSLAYSLTFQAADRTLTDEEVTSVFERIKEKLTKLEVELR